MASLEDLTRGTTVKGILPTHNVTVIDAKWHGSDVVELTYRDGNGQPHREILFRDRESTLEIVTAGQPWSFDRDGSLLRLVSEAHRIRLAHLDDDFEDSSSEEREAREEEVVDQATAARMIAELQAEIHQLGELENLALRVRRSGKDRKWDELSKLLQNSAEMFDAGGHRRKLVG